MYLNRASLNTTELADEKSATGFELIGVVGSWHGSTNHGCSEEGQGCHSSGGNGGEIHLAVDGV